MDGLLEGGAKWILTDHADNQHVPAVLEGVIRPCHEFCEVEQERGLHLLPRRCRGLGLRTHIAQNKNPEGQEHTNACTKSVGSLTTNELSMSIHHRHVAFAYSPRCILVRLLLSPLNSGCWPVRFRPMNAISMFEVGCHPNRASMA